MPLPSAQHYIKHRSTRTNRKMPYEHRSSSDSGRNQQQAAEKMLEKRIVALEKRRLEIHEVRMSLDLHRVPRKFAFYSKIISKTD